MNAGKSTILLQSSYNYNERGMQTLLFTYAQDNRYQKNTIHSRIGLKHQARPFSPNTDIYQETAIYKDKHANLACVLLDEAQFLTKTQVYQLSDISDLLKIPVLAYGLRTDFKGELFSGSKHLLAWADELVEVKTICHCGRKATMNMRVTTNGEKISEGEQIVIGGNDVYIATCRYHFKRGEVK